MSTAEKDPIMGIDLGTTNSVSACYLNGQYVVIPNDQGHRLTPSVVGFTGSQILIGNTAKDQSNRNPQNTISEAKRLIGTKFVDEEVQRDITKWGYKVIECKKTGAPKVQVKHKNKTKSFLPEQISGMVLGHLKKCAETFLGGPVTKAVITVPAYFNDGQRKSTMDAAKIGGFEVQRIINEPTAAALAYGLSETTKDQVNVVVYDYGGGTFDVTVLCYSDGAVDVRATGGDTHLGGEDTDQRLQHYMLSIISGKYNIDLSKDPKAICRLREGCEKLKKQLSSNLEAECYVPGLINGEDFLQKMTRAEFESMMTDLFKVTVDKVNDALKEAKMQKDEVHKVILVGGSSRIPLVQKMLCDNFGGSKAMTQCIDGDEVVAIGAAVLAHSLEAGSEPVVLCDVCPLSMGVALDDGSFSCIIDRNSKIPITCSKGGFTTVADNQPIVLIEVYEGERPFAKDNHKLGSLALVDLPLVSKGIPQLEITLSIDVDGVVHVTASEVRSGRKNKIEIQCDAGRLTKAEVDQFIKEAEDNKKEDQERQQRLITANELREYIYTAEKGLADYAADIKPDKLTQLQSRTKEDMQWIDSDTDSGSAEIGERLRQLKSQIQPVFDAVFIGRSGDTGDMEEAIYIDDE